MSGCNERADGAGRRHGCTQTASKGTEVRIHRGDGVYGAEDDRGVWVAWAADMRIPEIAKFHSSIPVRMGSHPTHRATLLPRSVG